MKQSIIILVIIASMLLLPLSINAEVQTLGTAKQGDCITLVQTYHNSTYTNFTKVQYPNKSIQYIGLLMSKNGADYNYSFCNTSALGQYIVTLCTDVDGVPTCVSYDFDITKNGISSGFDLYTMIGINIILLILILGLGWLLIQTEDYKWKLLYVSIMYLLSITFIFMLWVISDSYNVSVPVITTLLFFFWIVLLTCFFPFILVSGMYLLKQLTDEKSVKKYMGMGYEEKEAREHTKRG